MSPPPADPERSAAALAARLSSRPWRILCSGAASGAENMAMDRALLQSASREEAPPTLRFYLWAPAAVSVGRFQSTEGISVEYAARRGWDVVRRPTGGRAVLHQTELTYSITLPPSVVAGAGVRTSYAVLTRALNAGIRALLRPPRVCHREPSPESQPGVRDAVRAIDVCSGPASRRVQPNCFALAAECDTLVAGRKLIGSAQVRQDGALLQHGSILLDAEPGAWKALFGTAGNLVTLRSLLGRSPEPGEIVDAVLAGFRSVGILPRSVAGIAGETQHAPCSLPVSAHR